MSNSPVPKKRRMEAFHRDAFTCQYCGKKGVELTVDHIVPIVYGGRHTLENLRTACRSCNCCRKDRSIEDFRFRKTLGEAGLAPLLSTAQASALLELGIDLKLPEPYVFFFERRPA